MENIILEDTTLRDGEQSPGVAFSLAIKMNILTLLIDAGVRWIEAGIPVMGGSELACLSQMLERKNEANLIAWNRGVLEDVKQSIDLGFDYIHIGLPASDIHLKASVKKDRKWLFNKVEDLIKYAKDCGVFVSVSAEDVGRADLGFLQEYAYHVSACGADRLRLSDTIGILTPEQYVDKINSIKEITKIDLQCHAHNDFGLATANTLAAIKAGVKYFHVTVNGIGERAGMADIAQVVFALKYLYQKDLGIDGIKLAELSNYVCTVTNSRNPPWYPVMGENVFSHESGIHVNGMLRDVSCYEPFSPQSVGKKTTYVLGKHSGLATIKYFLHKSGVTIEDDKAREILRWVRERAMLTGHAVSEAEFITYCRSQIYIN